MVHCSPVRKFAEASEGVGYRHKLSKLVEESNNLISVSMAETSWVALSCLYDRKYGFLDHT
ncbi:MAG: hypothetical protein HDR88_07590 [Bacteroides sp.]|nr:hypothetical protein [Bacteroides sp.]